MQNMIFGEAPDFEKMMSAIQDLEYEINGQEERKGKDA